MNKNVPNILTITRIAFTPLIILFFMLPIKYGIGVFIALGLYILGCFTDFLDGKIARKYNLISDFGKFMDQIADKFITTTAIILVLFIGGVISNWLAVLIVLIIVLRDILVSGIRMYAASKSIVIAADIFGKIKSFFLDVSAMVFMLYIGLNSAGANLGLLSYIIYYAGVVLIVIGTLLCLISCVNYSIKAVKAIKLSKTKKEKSDESNA